MRVPLFIPSLFCTLLLVQSLPASAAQPTPGDAPPQGLIETNAEAVCFFMQELAGQPKTADCEAKAAQQLSTVYPMLPPDQRAQLVQLQAQWPMIRQYWQSLNETQKAAFRQQWAAMAQQAQQPPPQAQPGMGGTWPPTIR